MSQTLFWLYFASSCTQFFDVVKCLVRNTRQFGMHDLLSSM